MSSGTMDAVVDKEQPMPNEEKQHKTLVAVIGNGIMGHGIAEVFATAGHDVVLIGRNPESLEVALAKIAASVDEFVARGVLVKGSTTDALSRIRTETSLESAEGAGLVIEALPEDLALKVDTFGRLDEICSTDAILATASGHPVSEMSSRVSTVDRLVATHFWYPPQLLPLVEVCGMPGTSPDVVERTCHILRGVGKEPVVLDREIDGFIGNRLQFALLREAWALWADGIASASAIDAVVRQSIGRRLGVTGPLESADLGGLETMVSFARFLQPTLDVSDQPPQQVTALASGAAEKGLGGVRGFDAAAAGDLLQARRDELFRWLLAARKSPDLAS
jgi:3-hydroxybutyryl-CoA dehydrogenase